MTVVMLRRVAMRCGCARQDRVHGCAGAAQVPIEDEEVVHLLIEALYGLHAYGGEQEELEVVSLHIREGQIPLPLRLSRCSVQQSDFCVGSGAAEVQTHTTVM
jgi:hypothetical protein